MCVGNKIGRFDIYIYIRTYKLTHIRTYIRTYMHTYRHTYIHTHIHRGILPDYLKTAVVKSLYKKRDKTSMTNYRPVSLLLVVL